MTVSLVAEVGSVLIISGKVAVYGRRGAEAHIGAEVVAARFAELAVAARHARLDRYTVTHRKVLYFGSNLEEHCF